MCVYQILQHSSAFRTFQQLQRLLNKRGIAERGGRVGSVAAVLPALLLLPVLLLQLLSATHMGRPSGRLPGLERRHYATWLPAWRATLLR